MFDLENLERVIWLILIVLRRLRHFLFIRAESAHASLIADGQPKCVAVQEKPYTIFQMDSALVVRLNLLAKDASGFVA